MGNDGSAGAAAIKQRNGMCLAESEETAVIFGMPREAMRTGAIDKALPLGKLADEILARCTEPVEGAHA
jgi:two-component system chemotaxis response regulator CheB